MFVITDSAAKQFQASAQAVGDGALSLRVSASRAEGERIQYKMGFDEPGKNDISAKINGIGVVVDPASAEIVRTMVIDFREFEGQEQFVFLNPNDSAESCETSPSGCDPDGNPACTNCLDVKGNTP